MKTYSVYAIGAAIVDYEFHFHEELHLPTQLEKGGTVLIDDYQEKLLLKSLSHITPFKSCGGTSANTLSVLSGLGARVFESCKTANDEAGQLYHQNLQLHHIESNLDQAIQHDGDTGRCYILIDAEAERSIFTQIGANRMLSSDDLNLDALRNSEYLFVETFLSVFPRAKATLLTGIEVAKQVDCKIALTLSTCKIPGFDLSHVHDLVATGLDLLFCNELEAQFFCGTDNLQEIMTQLKKYARRFVITRGAQATLLFDVNRVIEVPTYPVTPHNTAGAGDAFAGAFLYALTTGLDFIRAGELGNFAAAQVVQKPGARLGQEDLKKVKAFLSKKTD